MSTQIENSKLRNSNTYSTSDFSFFSHETIKQELKLTSRASQSFIKESSIDVSFKEYDDYDREIQVYINDLNKMANEETDLVFLFRGNDFALRIYQLEESPLQSNGLPSIDFISALNELKPYEKEIIVLQLDINRPEEVTDQTEYKLYSSKGHPLDFSMLFQHKLIISSPLTDDDNPSFKKVQSLASMGINAFNRSEPFYNDMCYEYQNYTQLDLSMEERRRLYYPQKELCEPDCTFLSFKSNHIQCSCAFKTAFSNQITANPSTAPFPYAELQSHQAINCPPKVYLKEDIITNYAFLFFSLSFLLIILFSLYFLKNSLSLLKEYVHSRLSFKTEDLLHRAILSSCPPKSEHNKSGPHTPNKSVDTRLEEESFGEIKINNFQENNGSPLRQNFVKKGANKNDETKQPEDQTEKNLIEKLKRSLMIQSGVTPNENLHQYYFTRNSENESNPNYSKKCSTEMNQNDLKSGRSMTHYNKYDNKKTREMLQYNEDEASEKRGLAEFSSKLNHKGLVMRDDISINSKNDGKPFSVQHEISVSIQNRDKDDDNLLYASSKKGKLNRPKQLTPAAVDVINKDNTLKDTSKPDFSFCRSYCNYVKRREIFFITFGSKKKYLPFFIKFPIFLFCLTIIFTLHSLLYTNGFFQERFNKETITADFWFGKEFPRCLYTAIIGNAAKIIIIKLLVFFVFRIEKKILSRDNYRVLLNRLRCKSATVFMVVIILMFGLFYINTCYCGIFDNTQADFFIGYAVTVVFSVIFSLILCLLINIVGLIGVKCNCS